jgi:16S rRNA (cytosine1402-N4)-methyltransferase
MLFEHEPVLLEQVLALLDPKPGGIYCDATVGGGGHAEQVLEASAPNGRLIGIDRDPAAVAASRRKLARFGDRVSIYHGRFSELDKLMQQAGVAALDGLLVDFGVSSHQLDTAERGFSFMREGPLDMRMDTSQQETAGTLLTRLDETELADVIYRFGGERLSRPIARSIKEMARTGALATTTDLAVAVKRVVGRKKRDKIDPSTRTFQAIRIAVNRELEEIETLLELIPEPLAIGGRVVIISFHSLEDRLVKQRFKALVDPCTCPAKMPACSCPPAKAAYVTRRAVRVSSRERPENPRARSARVRAIRRIR